MFASVETRGFAERWLLEAGIPPEDIQTLRARSDARARRYPAPINWIYFVAMWLVEWLGPALMLGRLARASHLSSDAFDALAVAMRIHQRPMVRALFVMVIGPLMEVISEEAAPPVRPHPLEKQPGRALHNDEVFDVAVIGSGAGGAPLAAELAAAGLNVLVIEKGGLVRPDVAARTVETHYVQQGIVGSLEAGMALVIAGATVGGSTSINSGTCLRPRQDRLEAWDREWGTSFGRGQLDPYLDTVEKQIGVTVPPWDLLSVSSAIMDKGLKALDRPDAYVLPRNAPLCEGSGRCCFGCPTQAKRSTDIAYLPRAVADGAVLASGTTVTKIRERTGRVDLDLQGPDGPMRVSCRHLVIAAGGLFTPGLLHRNRLGDRRAQVGRHLRIHPAAKVFGHFPGLVHGDTGVPQGLGYRPPELPRITFEGIHTPKSAVGPMISAPGRRFHWWLDHLDEMASFGQMLRERTEGRVHELGGRPLIRYRLSRDDIDDFAAGLLLIADALFAAGADRVLLPVSGPVIEVESPARLARLKPSDFLPEYMLVSGFHPQGTAGIGRVVDTDLRLLGSDHVSICDASVLPDSPGVNPQVTIMALSLRLAERIRGELG